jgi:hypothetical protein
MQKAIIQMFQYKNTLLFNIFMVSGSFYCITNKKMTGDDESVFFLHGADQK